MRRSLCNDPGLFTGNNTGNGDANRICFSKDVPRPFKPGDLRDTTPGCNKGVEEAHGSLSICVSRWVVLVLHDSAASSRVEESMSEHVAETFGLEQINCASRGSRRCKERSLLVDALPLEG